MTEVSVPYGDNPADTATLLLAAAETQGLPPDVVRTSSDSLFYVPEEVASEAGLHSVKPDEEEDSSEPYDPADSGVAEVKAYVQEHPDTAPAVLEQERAGKDRSTLVEWLEGQVTDNNTPRSDS